ncbi:unnamed protein product [Prunus armeniaca]|uniref:COP1-interacting protein 7 n=1 Tax=Prunus armeniaca TaxID=36596 RepID=A0A6J5WWI6_PRUAR|nr:unnamed protein product [Prunus armeniaca]
MKSDTPLDYAVFQLSPKHSRCELFVSSNGNTEKLASGSVKPFVTHLKVAEEQVALAVRSIKLEVEKRKYAETSWFTKGTLERFVRFVSTPEVLELVNIFDAEMSQLEAARRIYSQGMGGQHAGTLGGDGTGITAAADATKKELLRAIDVRLVAVRQDLTTACARASAAGFNPDTVSELQLFADQFGAHRLNEACTKFSSLCQRRSDVINPWKPSVDDRAVRSSCESDMSIDDPTEDTSGPHVKPHSQPENKQEELEDPSRHSTCQQPTSLNANLPTQQRKNIAEKDRDEDKARVEKKDEPQTESTPLGVSQPARRLSVQDRISLFENKQKESSSSSSGGKPVVVAKPVELRRLSADVSSAPAVLRRWSGASDMSIDLSAEKKETESSLCTPSSVSSVSHTKAGTNIVSVVAEDKDRKGSIDPTDSCKVEGRSASGRIGDVELKDQTEGQTGVGVFVGKEEEAGSKVKKEQVGSQNPSRSSSARTEQVGLSDQGVSVEKLRISSGGEERSRGFKDQLGSETQSKGFSGRAEVVGVKNQVGGAISGGGFGNRVEDSRLREQSTTQLRSRGYQGHSRSFSGQFEGGVGRKLEEPSSAQIKGVEVDQRAPQHHWRSFSGDLGEQLGNVDLTSSDKQHNKGEDSGAQKMKFQKSVSASREQIKKSQGRREETNSVYESSKLDFTGDKVSINQESLPTMPTTPVEQVQRVRQTKGNQELNDELKIKANELEKLFAEHKLRIPGEQSSSARRSKPVDVKKKEQAVSSQYRKPAAEEIAPAQFCSSNAVMEPMGSSSDMVKFSTTPPLKMVGLQDYGDTLRQNFSEPGFSLDSKGKFYEKYMQKRDAKLREEWGSKREEKEAKLKAMEDSLEQSKAELKAKLSGSADRQDSVSSAQRREDKLRSFNFRSGMKREQPIDSVDWEKDEDLSDFPGQKLYGEDKFSSEALGDGVSRSIQNKKLFPNRNLSSPTPWTPAAPAPRSSSKFSNLSSGRRRPELENPLAQSVPNFSDFRKENTKPSSGVSKTAVSKVPARSQVKSYSRSKSISEEIMSKEEKPRRSQSLKKSSANPVEFNNLSPLNSDGVVLVPFDKEQTEHYDKFPKYVESKSFLRKGNGIGTGSGVSISKLKGSMASETLTNEEFDEMTFEAEDSVDMAKEEEEEELGNMAVEDEVDMDNGKLRLSQESEKSGNSGSDNVDSVRSLSQVDPASVAELPAAVPSTFHALGSLPDSPGESPMSWNLHMHHPFSYPHETSDVDASVDSPIGSPASWNSHGLTQIDVDAARMRKKWGSAQKPVLATNSAQNQSRKDMTKGFKRLLKFGRKSRGIDNTGDWISATTSEGDDDTEDGRDPANRLSEDLRKSRMGFMQVTDDSFNESEFNEQVEALRSSIPAPPMNFKLREDHLSGSSLKASVHQSEWVIKFSLAVCQSLLRWQEGNAYVCLWNLLRIFLTVICSWFCVAAPRSFFSLSSFRSKGSESKLR